MVAMRANLASRQSADLDLTPFVWKAEPAEHMSALSEQESELCSAIRYLRLVSFDLNGHHRIAEPHDLAVMNGLRRLFFYQVGGSSSPSGPLNWRLTAPAKLSNLRLLDEHFPGPHPAPSGRHHRWDRIIASVSCLPTS